VGNSRAIAPTLGQCVQKCECGGAGVPFRTENPQDSGFISYSYTSLRAQYEGTESMQSICSVVELVIRKSVVEMNLRLPFIETTGITGAE
jgi:hypothetical protein